MGKIRVAAALPGGMPRSRYWTFKTGRGSRDLYISREAMGEWAHISLHDRRDWHVALSHRNLDVGVAPEVSPGVRHAVSVVVAPSACRITTPAPERVTTVQLRAEAELRCGCFDLFLVDSPELDVVPGGSGGPVWSQPLGPDGARVQVFARAEAVPTIEFEVDAPPDRVRDAIDEIEAGTADALQVLVSNGGPVVILDGRLVMPD